MFVSIQSYIDNLGSICEPINAQRKAQLQELATIINLKDQQNLIFICTHNSRRSHFAQIWMHIVAQQLNLGKRIHSFSGGTEATAVNPRTIAALQRIGFLVSAQEAQNPKYKLSFSSELAEIVTFSKVYSYETNPQNNFIAVMTCDEAAEACPVVTGADFKFNLSYKDPKEADDTNVESSIYDARCATIAQEMFYLGRLIK
jgi:arsenate reductase